MQQLSRNEVEGLAAKAARGSGLPWGLAEDVGRSAVWLAAHGADWAGSLLSLLDMPPDAAHCPLRLGCYLADGVATPGVHGFAGVAHPAWLLPPLLTAAARVRVPVFLRLGEARLAASVRGVATASDPWANIFAVRRAAITAELGGAAPTLGFLLAAAPGRPELAAAPAERLHAYAARLLVPATADSERRGAGAGLRSNEDD